MKRRPALFWVLIGMITLVTFLYTAEIGLQVYKFQLVHKNVQPAGHRPSSDFHYILSLGESTTYGVHQSSADTYSALLEKALNRRAGQPVYKVLNFGYPAAISDDIVQLFDDLMSVYKPTAVIASLGNNDFVYEINYKQRGIPRPTSHPFKIKEGAYPSRRKRVLLVQLLQHHWYNQQSAGWGATTDRMKTSHLVYNEDKQDLPANWRKQFSSIRKNLRRNIRHLQEACSQQGIPFVMVGYITSHANGDLMGWHQQYDIPFVNNHIPNEEQRQGYVIHRTRMGWADFFHPNKRGHQYMADNILHTLLKVKGFNLARARPGE